MNGFKKRPTVKPKVTKTLTNHIPLTLQHVVLYAKGWYLKTDVVEDLKKCLTADDYSGEVFNKNDVARLLLTLLEKLPYNSNRGLSKLYFDTRPENCWCIGYKCKDKKDLFNIDDLPEYDSDIAAIHFCLRVFEFIAPNEWNPTVPNFEKVLPRNTGITDEKLIVFNSLIQNR